MDGKINTLIVLEDLNSIVNLPKQITSLPNTPLMDHCIVKLNLSEWKDCVDIVGKQLSETIYVKQYATLEGFINSILLFPPAN